MTLRLAAIAGAALYLFTLIAVPLANTDRDVLRLHPEDLVDARWGWLVIVGWLVFAVALLAIALMTMRGGPSGWIAAACFIVAALVCVANANDPSLGVRRSPVELGVFGLVAGPLIASFTAKGVVLRVIAVAAALAFGGILFEAAATGGMVNRIFDALAAVWCIVFAVAWRRERGIMRPSGEVA